MTDPLAVPHSLRDRRRLAIAHSATQRGLDHVESEPLAAKPADSTRARYRLRLYFVATASRAQPKAAIPPGLQAGNIRLSVLGGGDPGLRIIEIPTNPEGPVLDLIAERTGPPPHDAAVASGGMIVYTLTLTGVPNLDRFFSEAAFTLDGMPPPPAASVPVAKAPTVSPTSIDYLAKDYESFRRLMLERMTLAVPSWTERNPADFGVAVIEALAYAADNLSYYQDAVATEAYLGTARRRISLARHARLLDYSIGNGANARTWLQVDVAKKMVLKRGVPAYAEGPGAPAAIAARTATTAISAAGVGSPADAGTGDPGVDAAISNTFEIMADTLLVPEHLVMKFYTWGAMEYTLAAGTTSAALVGSFSDLDAGDVLIFAPADSTTGSKVKNAPLGHPVRLSQKPRVTIDPAFGTEITEIIWFAADALPDPLPVAGRVSGTLYRELAWVLGNLVPIDQGQTVSEVLPPVPAGPTYSPALAKRWITQAPPFDPAASRKLPATGFLQPETRLAMPRVELAELASDGTCLAAWLPVPDLLGSGAFSQAFVVEVETDGTAHLRFGDGQYGRRPLPGTRFSATYRVGLGADGNLGPGTINRLFGVQGVTAAGNPLQAVGGADPEYESRIRLLAPQALAAQERCVTEADFVDAAESFPGVLRAAAIQVWTGSWTTAFVYVEREGGRPFDPYFETGLYAYLEIRLLAGTALRILPPRYLPLDIALAVHLRAGALRYDVERALQSAFSATEPTGFFSADRFTFGQPVFLSEVIACAAAVPGVLRIEVLRFERWGQPARGEIDTGRIQPEMLEIVRAESIAGAPQLGGIEFLMERSR